MSLKPSYVQFENHGVGKWKTFDLKDSIDMLDAMEYECFWSTNSLNNFESSVSVVALCSIEIAFR